MASNEQAGERPSNVRTTILVLAVALGASVVLTGWIDASKVGYRGRLMARETIVEADRAGRVADVLAVPGTDVREGQPLLLLEKASAERIAELEAEAESLRARIARARARVDVEISWRMKDVDQEILETELRAAEFLRQRFDQVLGDLVQGEFPATSAIAPAMPADSDVRPVALDAGEGSNGVHVVLARERIRNAREVVDAQLELCDRRLAELRALRDRLADEVRAAHGVDELEKAIHAVETERRELPEAGATEAISSPTFGSVESLSVGESDLVERGERVAVLVDDARRFVQVPVPSSAVRRFAGDARVLVLFPGGETRRGRVREVPMRAVVPRSRVDEPSAESYLLVEVVPDGKIWPALPLGTNVEVRSLVEE